MGEEKGLLGLLDILVESDRVLVEGLTHGRGVRFQVVQFLEILGVVRVVMVRATCSKDDDENDNKKHDYTDDNADDSLLPFPVVSSGSGGLVVLATGVFLNISVRAHV